MKPNMDFQIIQDFYSLHSNCISYRITITYPTLDDDCTNIWKEIGSITMRKNLKNKKKTYTKRDTARIIRYRNYDMAEMVLLHVSFEIEENDIIV